MAQTYTIKVDSKSRLTIPRALREALGIEPGDVMFVVQEENGAALRYAKAENPFDALARHAIEEHRAGRTIRLRDYARENNIKLDDE